MNQAYENPFLTASEAAASERALFIRRTYIHLAGALIAFVALEAALLKLPGIEKLIALMTGGYGWLIVLAAFMGVSWLADKWARSDASPSAQYLGLGVYIVAEAVIFLPLLYIAAYYSDPTIIPTAGIITGLLFAGLTATAFMTRKDFSFLRSILTIGGFVAMGVIICSIVFGFTLGLLFSAIMVFFAGGSILYTTSNIIHHYRTDQHVAASLALFSGVMLLFWYILRILLLRSRN
ncbi:Bax inhibitor-1/YccA family protein [Ereboglobus luteus]|uniref:Permease n=1 Tax=Ereboglobus luteus TaxID=1796921 RepID=A0A2U8E6Z2_9BACT|nr:Bax inhibitor-1 family protein [Ereboglobus luteus]AWI10596.1 permease [Ereboglobus luteus]